MKFNNNETEKLTNHKKRWQDGAVDILRDVDLRKEIINISG